MNTLEVLNLEKCGLTKSEIVIKAAMDSERLVTLNIKANKGQHLECEGKFIYRD